MGFREPKSASESVTNEQTTIIVIRYLILIWVQEVVPMFGANGVVGMFLPSRL